MGFTTTVPIEETFLRIFDKPRKVRLNRQVIHFNYAHLSPFQNGGMLFFQADQKIYVWYFAKPFAGRNVVAIPEGYLLLRNFQDRQNAIVLLPRKNSWNALVIARGELLAQVTFQITASLEHSLDLLRREYSIVDAELVRLDPNARFRVKPADMAAFAHFEFNTGKLFEKSVALAKVPVMAALLIVAGFTFYQSMQLDAANSRKKSYLDALKLANAPIQATLERVRDQNDYWREFINREQAYPDFHRILSQAADAVVRHGGYLNMVEFAENRLTLWVGLKSSEAEIIKDLLSTGYFQEVKLLSSTKDSAKPDFNVFNLAITLRRQKGPQS